MRKEVSKLKEEMVRKTDRQIDWRRKKCFSSDEVRGSQEEWVQRTSGVGILETKKEKERRKLSEQKQRQTKSKNR